MHFYLTPNKTTSTKSPNSKSALPKPCMTRKRSCQIPVRSTQKKSGPCGIRSLPTSSGPLRLVAGVKVSPKVAVDERVC